MKQNYLPDIMKNLIESQQQKYMVLYGFFLKYQKFKGIGKHRFITRAFITVSSITG